jgi:hypothetical protein
VHAIVGWFIRGERWYEPTPNDEINRLECVCGEVITGWNSAVSAGLATQHLRNANALNGLLSLQRELKEVSPSRYCDACTENPAKKTITEQMAGLFRMDPKTKVCPTCFDQMDRQVKAIK